MIPGLPPVQQQIDPYAQIKDLQEMQMRMRGGSSKKARSTSKLAETPSKTNSIGHILRSPIRFVSLAPSRLVMSLLQSKTTAEFQSAVKQLQSSPQQEKAVIQNLLLRTLRRAAGKNIDKEDSLIEEDEDELKKILAKVKENTSLFGQYFPDIFNEIMKYVM